MSVLSSLLVPSGLVSLLDEIESLSFEMASIERSVDEAISDDERNKLADEWASTRDLYEVAQVKLAEAYRTAGR